VTPRSVAARLYPWRVDPDPEFRRALAFLGWSVDPAAFLRAWYGVGVASVALTAAVAAFAPAPVRVSATLAVGTLPVLVVYGARVGPKLVATARRVRSLGAAPDLVARAVLHMRLAPAPTRAAAFAAAGDGPLARSLRRHVRRARRGSTDPLETFGAEWEPWLPSLRRALALVSVASRLSAADRDRALDSALEVVLDGTRRRLRSFGGRIQGPINAVYAFGVLLPTALVSLLPAARAAGIGVTPATVVLLYDLLLPAGLVVAAGWLLAHRPVAFPPPDVSIDHPAVPDRTAAAAVAGVTAGSAGWFGAVAFFPEWAAPVAALGFGTGTALLMRYRPVLRVYGRARGAESGLSDALSVVGRHVANGEAVETAIHRAGDELSGETADLLRTTALRQRTLQIGVDEALFGEHGPLQTVPSPRVRISFAFLGVAAREGQPAGPAILALAGHIDDLRRVEEAARHDLRSVCGTLQTTGTVFGPLVAGATVALAEGTATGGTAGGPLPAAGSIPWLGSAVGLYVLALAVILPTLSTALVRGLDRALVGTRVGRSLLAATSVYLGAFLLVSGVA
jgi:hypothetical protein